MRQRIYPRLSVEDFGRQLIQSGDLDPVYIALRGCEWPEDQLKRWLVAYSFLYHVGLSCWLSECEGESFWRAMAAAAWNTTECPIGGRWPRATERRHWRGDAAVSCVNVLASRYGAQPEDMVAYLASGDLSFPQVSRRVREHPACGPWIAYKWGDLLERVLGVPVVFSKSDAMYDSPRKAALEVWRMKMGFGSSVKVRDEGAAVDRVLEFLLNEFGNYEAPPGGRKVGYQEIETILCKVSAHWNGYYPLWNDIEEIGLSAEPWSKASRSVREFLLCFPRKPVGFMASSAD